MANGAHSDVWKWIATTLAGLALGGLVASALPTMQIQALSVRFRTHELAPSHVGTTARMDAIDSDIAELKNMLRDAIEKMDRYHQSQ